MKILYTTKNVRMTVELEGKTQTDLFEQLWRFQEVFENTTCTRNGVSSDDVRFIVREVDGNKYYELRCVDTRDAVRGATLAFGLHKHGGTMFPKRKEENEKGEEVYLPNNGWVVYDKKLGKKV